MKVVRICRIKAGRTSYRIALANLDVKRRTFRQRSLPVYSQVFDRWEVGEDPLLQSQFVDQFGLDRFDSNPHTTETEKSTVRNFVLRLAEVHVQEGVLRVGCTLISLTVGKHETRS